MPRTLTSTTRPAGPPSPAPATSIHRRMLPSTLADSPIGEAAVTRGGDCVLIVDKPPTGEPADHTASATEQTAEAPPAAELLLVYQRGIGLHRRPSCEVAFPVPLFVESVEAGRFQRDGYVAGFMHRVCRHQPLGRLMFGDAAAADDWFAGYTAAGDEADGPSPITDHVWNAHTVTRALASYAAWRLEQITRPFR